MKIQVKHSLCSSNNPFNHQLFTSVFVQRSFWYVMCALPWWQKVLSILCQKQTCTKTECFLRNVNYSRRTKKGIIITAKKKVIKLRCSLEPTHLFIKHIISISLVYFLIYRMTKFLSHKKHIFSGIKSKCNTNQLSIWYLTKKAHIRQTKKAYQSLSPIKMGRNKKCVKKKFVYKYGWFICNVIFSLFIVLW